MGARSGWRDEEGVDQRAELIGMTEPTEVTEPTGVAENDRADSSLADDKTEYDRKKRYKEMRTSRTDRAWVQGGRARGKREKLTLTDPSSLSSICPFENQQRRTFTRLRPAGWRPSHRSPRGPRRRPGWRCPAVRFRKVPLAPPRHLPVLGRTDRGFGTTRRGRAARRAAARRSPASEGEATARPDGESEDKGFSACLVRGPLPRFSRCRNDDGRRSHSLGDAETSRGKGGALLLLLLLSGASAAMRLGWHRRHAQWEGLSSSWRREHAHRDG